MRAADSTYASILGSILSTADARSLGPRNFTEPGLSISNTFRQLESSGMFPIHPRRRDRKRRNEEKNLDGSAVLHRGHDFAAPGHVRLASGQEERDVAAEGGGDLGEILRVAADLPEAREQPERDGRVRAAAPQARPPSGRAFRDGSALAARFRPRGPGASPRARRCCRRPPALPERCTRARVPRRLRR